MFHGCSGSFESIHSEAAPSRSTCYQDCSKIISPRILPHFHITPLIMLILLYQVSHQTLIHIIHHLHQQTTALLITPIKILLLLLNIINNLQIMEFPNPPNIILLHQILPLSSIWPQIRKKLFDDHYRHIFTWF